MYLIRIISILMLAWGSSHAFFSSGNSGSGPTFSFTHNKPALTNLYNQKISSLQEYQRPLSIKPIFGVDIAGGLNKIGINHRGQVATLQNGQNYLVHKGPGFGLNSQTVVVGANQMSNQWKPAGSSIQSGSQSVRLGDLVRAGGSKYNVLCSNCINAANNMGNRFRQGR